MSEASPVVRCPSGPLELMRAVVGMLLFPVRQGSLEYENQVFRFPLPRRSTRLGKRAGLAVYLALSPRDLAGLFSAQAQAHGWTYVEQMGAAYNLTSERYRLLVTTRQCIRHLIMMSFTVSRL
jgi:hypothetical protein